MAGWVRCTRVDSRQVWINLDAAKEIEVQGGNTAVIFANGDKASVMLVREPPDQLLAARRHYSARARCRIAGPASIEAPIWISAPRPPLADIRGTVLQLSFIHR